MNDKKLKKLMIEAFKQAKPIMIQSGAKFLRRIFTDVMELDGTGESPETIHTVQEHTIAKGLFFAHAVAVEKYCDMVCQMLHDGVIKVDQDSLSKAAESIREAMNEEADDDAEDDEDE